MSKFLKTTFSTLAITLLLNGVALAQDIKAGEKVYKKCKACHMVGEKAKNKVGPHLNDVFARPAGVLEGYKFSSGMKKAGKEGIVWNDETLDAFLIKPKKYIKGTKMGFAGLKKEKDRVNLIAYLKQFSKDAAPAETTPEKTEDAAKPEEKAAASAPAIAAKTVLAKDAMVPKHGVLHLGRVALKEEITAWDTDIRPDGKGLPIGRGSVAQGEPLYADNCASCHGDFGEGTDRWPVLAGGQDTLTEERPEKTVGSYWPYLSTVYDYIKRAMPFGNARSLSDDEVYALTAYVLYLNDIVTDEDFVLSNENFGEIRLPNEANFIADNRNDEPQYNLSEEPCMSNCMAEPAKVIMRARVLDVTPEGQDDNAGAGAIE